MMATADYRDITYLQRSESAVPKDIYDTDYPIIGISKKSKSFPFTFQIEWETGEKSFESYEYISLKALAAFEKKQILRCSKGIYILLYFRKYSLMLKCYSYIQCINHFVASSFKIFDS